MKINLLKKIIDLLLFLLINEIENDDRLVVLESSNQILAKFVKLSHL